LKFTRRIKRTRSGEFELRLSPEEREVLRGLPAQMRDALALGKNDPAVARLNPSACLDDAEVDAEFHRLMDDDLNAGRMEALEAFEKTVDNVRLDEEGAVAWLRAVNDVRLLLGTRLDVSEEPGERHVPDDDPRAPGFALYDYLSLLTQELVEALDT
jgi:uncharacterized protein DUF2017